MQSSHTPSDMRAAKISILLVVVCACRSRDASSNESRSESVAARDGADAAQLAAPDAAALTRAREPPFEGTAGIVARDAGVGAPALLRDVRSARHVGYDRVVFEFSEGLPNYHVAYVDRPVRKCGSGDPTAVAGDAWLEVRFNPANAHDERGATTVHELERQTKLGVLLELEQTCDFEAHVTWVLGLAKPNRYRVLELSSPWRIAVDVLHVS
jgi:hypothetical protein